MTSLEHESNDTSVSASDYGNDNWDNENWGEMDVSDNSSFYLVQINVDSFYFTFAQTSQDPSSPLATVAASSIPLQSSASIAPSSANRQSDIRDGWDNDEWGSLEEEPVRFIGQIAQFDFEQLNLTFRISE